MVVWGNMKGRLGNIRGSVVKIEGRVANEGWCSQKPYIVGSKEIDWRHYKF